LTCAEAGAPPIRLSTRKSAGLIAYLAMAPDQAAGREELATLLWGTCTDQLARQSLRQALALLRKELRDPRLLIADADMVRLQAGAWAIDARDFEESLKSPNAEQLNRAASLFGGEFLAGHKIDEEGFEEWVRVQRQRTQLAAFRLCETFAARPELVSDGEHAIAVTERLLALDPLREDCQRIALVLYARYRGRNEALAQAEVFAGLMQRELAVKLEAETRHLVERIRAGEIAAAPIPVQRETVVSADPNPAGSGRAVVNHGDVSSPASRQAVQARRSPPLRALAITAAAIAVVGGVVGFSWLRRDASAPAGLAPATASIPAGYWQSPSQPADSAAKDIIPIAVLPLAALGDTSGSTQLIADMMTDDLINVLSRVPSFRVISRQTTSRYQGQPIDIGTVGAELRVRYVLEGSARVQDGGLRVNVQLFDPLTRLPVWSGRVEREGADRYAIRDEIVGRIARELQIDILPIEGERRAANDSADGFAYLGWAAMQAAFATISLEQYGKAEAYFRQALERDPRHLRALMGIGAYHANLAVQRLDADTAQHFAKAETLLTDIVRRDPRNATAHHFLGVLYQGSRRLQEGIRHFQKAVELNPSAAGSHAHIGHALARMGQAEKGIEYIRYAMRLGPKDPAVAIWHEFIGNAQLELTHYTEAIASFRQSATLAPHYPRAWAGLAAALALSGDADGAKANLERLKTFAVGLDAKRLIERFGRRAESRLHEGLRLALAPTSDPWQSPPLPSGRQKGAALAAGTLITSMGVLPFSTPDPAGASVHVADIVTDDLTEALARVPSLRVISPQTMRSYAGKTIDVAAIGAELKVHYLLEGTVRADDNKLRVNVQLIDPGSRLAVWTDRIERDASAGEAVRNEIVARLGRKLHVEVLRRESERNATHPGPRETLYKGWRLLFEHAKKGLPPLLEAEGIFKAVLERDPKNLAARHGLGHFHILVGSLRLVPDWAAHLDAGEEIMRGVLAEDPDNSGAHFTTGILQRLRGQYPQALDSYQRSVELNPSNAAGYAHIGHTLVQMGRAAEGIEHIRYALRLSPRDATSSHWLRFAGEAEIELGHYAEALALLRRSYALNPRQPLLLRSLAAAEALAGELDQARQHLAELKAVAPHFSPQRRRSFSEGSGLPEQPELMRGIDIALAHRS
jgi:TolB-like protein/DNA-binding SARP family transcriptional activator/Tfp pilus assembly protein PilF